MKIGTTKTLIGSDYGYPIYDDKQPMKPTTFDQEIYKILFDFGGLHDKYTGSDIEETKIALRSLLQTTIRESLPEKKDVCAWEDAMERDEHQDLGFNSCLDTITSNLQKAGLLTAQAERGGEL